MDEKPDDDVAPAARTPEPQKSGEANRKGKGLDFNVMETRSTLPFVILVFLSLIVLAGLLIVWLKFL
ncbi:MAG: hypothetical protein ACYS8W_12505 [Planctomycetota bacterium]|jgi:hypothetical protein